MPIERDQMLPLDARRYVGKLKRGSTRFRLGFTIELPGGGDVYPRVRINQTELIDLLDQLDMRAPHIPVHIVTATSRVPKLKPVVGVIFNPPKDTKKI